MAQVSSAQFKAAQLILLAAMVGVISSCGDMSQVQLGEPNEPLEIGNQLGDVMASIDDAGKGTSTIAFMNPSVDRFNQSSSKSYVYQQAWNFLVPTAMAATCGASQFGSCSSNTMIRSFNGCTIGGYTLNGSVTMNWSGGTTCALTAQSQTIRISPSYTVAGNNMTLTATKTGTYGVTLTLTSAASAATKTWTYSNDGINRKLAYNGTTLLDLDTSTTSAMTITGSARTNRSLSGGALQVVNNTTGENCSFTPSSVSWGSSTCNCATTGTWTGTCSNLGTYTMTFTSCGVATINYTQSGTSKQQTISLDRCVSN